METDLKLESSVFVGNQRYRAVLTGWHFNWTEVDKKHRDKKTISVPVAEVLAVEEGRVEILPKKLVEDKDKDFTVFYVKRSSSRGSSGLLWRLGRTQFRCPSRVLRDQWTKHLRAAVKTHSPLRPHKLLVFINPFGGKRKGRKIYHSVVAPLFELVGISSHVIVTERANQARDHLLKKDLTGFDGVVCVGGDGMFGEILHGDSQPLDVCSVHHASALVRYSVSLVGYGFYGDVLAESEKHRWMGPLRYDYSGAVVYLSNRSYKGIVQYLPADRPLSSPRDKTRCLSGCCPKSPQGLSPSAHLADGTGDLILVWDTNPLGFLKFLYRHTSTQDQFDLPFVEVHRVKAVRFSLASGEEEDAYEELAGQGSVGMDEEDRGYVETVSRSSSQQQLAAIGTRRQMTKELKTPSPFLCGLCCSKSPPVSVWNCDGEILPFTEIVCRIHCQLVRLYARGIEDGTAAHNCSEESDKCERRCILH
ncbi:hypothetical protein F2P81_011624 [Scophthalmus maximus]|uniref:DAGKc domain-containing protein n=1 Tax=Scophthalmus maximus TaxID=52904 RepID=A0A6A4T264_SCOMX|nr:hypothetical protein F2P81_011624 [Scophthalmus maximus]